MKLELVIAVDDEWGIGKDGDLPWYHSEDLKNFAKITKLAPKGKKNAVIMGRTTYLSLPKRPLPSRVNFLMTRQNREKLAMDLSTAGEFVKFDKRYARHKMYIVNNLTQVENLMPDLYKAFIIGGAEIYKHCIQNHAQDIDAVHLTRVPGLHGCDTFVPEISDFLVNEHFISVSGQGYDGFSYQEYRRT